MKVPGTIQVWVFGAAAALWVGVGCNLITGADRAATLRQETGGGGTTSATTSGGGGLGGSSTTATTATTGIGGSGGTLASCSDGLRNGEETDVDCGGSPAGAMACLACSNGRKCKVGADCASGSCAAEHCAPWGTVLGESLETRSVVTSDSGDIYVGGYFSLPGDPSKHHAVVKYGSSPTCKDGFCTPVWAFPPSGPGGPPYLGNVYTMALDQKHETIYLAGDFSSSSDSMIVGAPACVLKAQPGGPASGMLLALGTDGKCKWSTTFPGQCPASDGGPPPSCNVVRVLGVVADSAGDVYVTGWFNTEGVDLGVDMENKAVVKTNSATLPSSNVFAAKIQGGAGPHPVLWARSYGSNLPGNSVQMHGTSIALLPRPAGGDDLVIGGYFTGPTSFASASMNEPHVSLGGEDGFVLALRGDDDGKTDWITDVYDDNGVDPHKAQSVTGLVVTATKELAFAAVDHGSVVVGTLSAGEGALQAWAPRIAFEMADVGPSAIAASGGDLLVGWFSIKSYNPPYPPSNEFFHLTKIVPDPQGGGAQLLAWQKDYGPIENTFGWDGTLGLAVNARTQNVLLAGYFHAPTLAIVGGTLFTNPKAGVGSAEAFLASLGPQP